jgi:hypothetical protein
VAHCKRAVSATLAAWLLGAGIVSAQTVPPHSLVGQATDLADRVSSALGPTPASGTIGSIVTQMSLEIATIPLGTSTGGFTFAFDPVKGTFERSARTFGPAFGERSLTTGRGKFTVAFTTLHASYDSIGGLNLANGDLRFAKNVTPSPNTPVSSLPITMDLTSDTVVGTATYGVSNDLDITVTVPWVRVALAVDVGAFTATGVDVTPGGHAFVLPKTVASGVGDVALSAKYHFLRERDGGLAAGFQVRLPSGDVNNLRGVGLTRTSVSGIWSRGGTVSPHASIGYEFWSDRVQFSSDVFAKNQLNYVLGLEARADPRTTITVEVLGRRLLHGGKNGYITASLAPGISGEFFAPLPEGLNTVSVAPGVKWNVAGNVLLTGSVLVSVANQGVRANIIPVVGFEWAF